MKRFINYFRFIFIFTIVWIILNERLNWFQVFTGIIISIISIFFTNYFLLFEDYSLSYNIKLSTIFKYSVYLLFQIYKSGLTSILKIIKGEDRVKIIEYTTSITDELSICLLSHAITLTPGTVTIDKTNNNLKVLAFYDNEDFNNDLENNSLAKFEEILKRR